MAHHKLAARYDSSGRINFEYHLTTNHSHLDHDPNWQRWYLAGHLANPISNVNIGKATVYMWNACAQLARGSLFDAQECVSCGAPVTNEDRKANDQSYVRISGDYVCRKCMNDALGYVGEFLQ